MRWLIDTNVVSETIRPRPEKRVIEWLDKQPSDLTAISIVTFAELRRGVLLRGNNADGRRLIDWVETSVSAWFKDRILPLTSDILIEWIDLSTALAGKGKMRNPPDLLLAATALIHGLTIASRNTRDFAATGVTVYNPWTGETTHMS